MARCIISFNPEPTPRSREKGSVDVELQTMSAPPIWRRKQSGITHCWSTLARMAADLRTQNLRVAKNRTIDMVYSNFD
ncbi:hypothetical protein BDN70DRAFT_883357, partial [Pholiota conissans]